jgi:hypothetical protein
MPKLRKYGSESIDLALQEIQDKKMSVRAIAAKYGIPKSTIHFKLKNPSSKDTYGPVPYLSIEEEQRLVKWISEMGKRGFPRKVENLLSSVKNFLDHNPRPNPFKNNRPGKGWLKAFLKRNPTVTQRQSEAVSSASACVTEQDIRKWFQEIDEYFTGKDLGHILNNGSRIFNADETGFNICPSTGKVLAQKGTKNVHSIEKGSSKENVTVMCAFSASGQTCPPMIIYPYQRIPEKILKTVPPQWGIAKSDRGWMTAEVFYEYVANIFHPYLVKQNVIFPVILFVDGHKSHITYDLSVLCNLQIELIALYPNATRILQPADVAAFCPIKSAWRKAVREFNENYPDETVNKKNIAGLLQNILMCVKPETLINGFRVCGLCPFNSDAVDYTKCLGSTSNKNENHDSVIHEENVVSRRTIDYETFVNIVGMDCIKEFNSFRNDETDNVYWEKLRSIWTYLQETRPFTETIDTPSKLLKMPIPSDGSQQTQLTCNTSVTSNYSPQNPIEYHLSPVNVLPSCSSIMCSPMACSSPRILDSVPGNQNTGHLSPPTKTVEPHSSCSTKISPFLAWPHSPKRKNKRQVERTPYALTSEKFQKIFEAKKALKFQQHTEKEERKKKRAERKQEQKTKRKSQRNLCGKCHKEVRKSPLSCSNCHKNFHRSCVPITHREHVPDDEGDDYLCHFCYKEDSEDSCDQVTNEDNSDDDDIDELYAMYQAECKINNC